MRGALVSPTSPPLLPSSFLYMFELIHCCTPHLLVRSIVTMSDPSLPATAKTTTSHPAAPTIVTALPAAANITANPSDFLLITDKPLESYNPQQLVASPATGATSIFLGTTRDHFGERRVLHLSYECYTAMATQQLQQLANEMRTLWAARPRRHPPPHRLRGHR